MGKNAAVCSDLVGKRKKEKVLFWDPPQTENGKEEGGSTITRYYAAKRRGKKEKPVTILHPRASIQRKKGRKSRQLDLLNVA